MLKNIKVENGFLIVHRLDKLTTGCLMIAKNKEFTRIFGELF